MSPAVTRQSTKKVHNQNMATNEKQNRRGAFIVIKSAEGKRTPAHRFISSETYEAQRKALERSGIQRVRPVMPR